jgi:hypothetical protein
MFVTFSADAAVDPKVKIVNSGNLLTGQNPASAKLLAEELLKQLLLSKRMQTFEQGRAGVPA